jgi:hypothetical protein
VIGPAEVRANDTLRVDPRQWYDFRTLAGDPRDGIHGGSGMGCQDRRPAARWQARAALEALPASGRLAAHNVKPLVCVAS